MTEDDFERLRGLVDLAHTGVERVTGLVERNHRRAAGRTFGVLEAVPGVAAPARAVRVVHDAVLTVTYGSIFGINRALRAAGVVATDLLRPVGAEGPVTTPASDGGPDDER